MLDLINAEIGVEKRKDLVRRLTNKRAEQIFGAEMELALSYAFSQLYDTEIEPEWFPGTKKPDLYVEDFFDSPAFVEITAISDRKVMRSASQKISQYVNQLKKGRGKFLYFEFQERSGYRLSRPEPRHPVFPQKEFYRERLISKDFKLCSEFKRLLDRWIKNPNWPDPQAIRIKLDYVDVVIRVKDYAYPSTHNFHSSMPALCYSLEDNPIFKALKEKESQLKCTPSNNLRVVFLCDGGCSPLKDLNGYDPTNRVKSAKEIIRHYLSKDSQLDHVVVVAPKFEKSYSFGPRYKKSWAVTQFNGLRGNEKNYQTELGSLFSLFPPPRYESYNAKGLILQGIFKPNNRDQHLGTSYMTKGRDTRELQVKTSSKALYELMSGRLNFEEFKKITGIEGGTLKSEYRIINIEFDQQGPVEDDDYVIVTLSTDVAATGLVE